MNNLLEEHLIGKLCENGYMNEEYDLVADDFNRTITSKGLNKIKEILKDPKYKKEFIAMAKAECLKQPIEIREALFKQMTKILKD